MHHFTRVEGVFLVDNTCLALLVDQLGSFGMAAGFSKLSTQKHNKNLRNQKIYINIQTYCDCIIFIFS